MVSNKKYPQGESLPVAEMKAQFKKLWEKEGDIEKAVKAVRAHPDHKWEADETWRRQRQRVLGEDALLNGEVRIPERAGGPVYRPVEGRIMYCAYSTPAFNSNGYSTRTRGIASGLRSAGADIVVVARAGYPWDWKVDVEKPPRVRTVVEIDDVKYVHLPNGNIGSLSPDIHIEQAAEAFVQEALIQRPSIMHSASNYRTAMPALIAARRLGIPFVYEVRGLWEITGASNNPSFGSSDQYFAMRDYESRVAREADHVFAITKQVKNELVARGVDEHRISLAPNAVDPTRFIPMPPAMEFSAKHGLEAGVPTIGFAGSIVKYEGLETLLSASQILQERGVEHQVVLAGSGNTEAKLIQFANTQDMSWVHFLGRLPQDDIPLLLSSFDIVVTPRVSTVITELVSALKPLEAFSAGRAVLLSDVEPNVDLAGSGGIERALLFAAGNAVNMADKLQELIEKPMLRAKLGKAGREWIEQERNWPTVAGKMLELYPRVGTEFIARTSQSVELAQLKVGVIADQAGTDTLEEHVQVVSLDIATWGEESARTDLDLLIVDTSSDLFASLVKGSKGKLHSSFIELMREAGLRGIPRVAWYWGGLAELSQLIIYGEYFDHVHTLDYEILEPFYEDPTMEDVILGALPPCVFNQEVTTPSEVSYPLSVLVVSEDGRRVQRPSPLLELDDLEGSTVTQGPDESNNDETALDTSPGIVYFRDGVSRSTVNKLLPEVKGAVLMSEGHLDNDGWLGAAIAENVTPLEVSALCYFWSAHPEEHARVAQLQQCQMGIEEGLSTHLALLARKVGIPVTVRRVSSDAEPETGCLPTQLPLPSREELLVDFVRDNAESVVPRLVELSQHHSGPEVQNVPNS